LPVLTVVGQLQFDGRDVAVLFVEARVVEPDGVVQGGDFDFLGGLPRLLGLINSVL
jgi:hypothetical protein